MWQVAEVHPSSSGMTVTTERALSPSGNSSTSQQTSMMVSGTCPGTAWQVVQGQLSPPTVSRGRIQLRCDHGPAMGDQSDVPVGWVLRSQSVDRAFEGVGLMADHEASDSGEDPIGGGDGHFPGGIDLGPFQIQVADVAGDPERGGEDQEEESIDLPSEAQTPQGAPEGPFPVSDFCASSSHSARFRADRR